MNDIRLLIASLPDMEEIVVEMWHGDTHLGEGFRKDGQVFVRWRGTGDVTMTIEEWSDLLRRIGREYGR
jgi:hypothetical protein